jgi:hypothetical protein
MKFETIIILLLVFCCTMPVNADNNIDVSMNVIYIGLKYNSQESFTGGNVSENYYIKNYISNTSSTQGIVYLSRFGTPMIRLSNGSEPKVMIVAGVHGNELPAQIAAIKMINYLKNRNINGTVYITQHHRTIQS